MPMWVPWVIAVTGTGPASYISRQVRRSHAVPPSGATMQWSIIALNFFYAVLGVALMFIAYRVIDRLTPEVNFPEELRKGNVAVAIFVAAIFLSVAIVVAGALN